MLICIFVFGLTFPQTADFSTHGHWKCPGGFVGVFLTQEERKSEFKIMPLFLNQIKTTVHVPNLRCRFRLLNQIAGSLLT